MPCGECCNAGGRRGRAGRSRVGDGTGDLLESRSRLGAPRPFRPSDSLSIRYSWPFKTLESVDRSVPLRGIMPTPRTGKAYARPILSSRTPPKNGGTDPTTSGEVQARL